MQERYARSLIGVCLLLCQISGCAAPRPTLPLNILDVSDQILYVREGALWRVDTHGRRPERLIDLKATILAPSWAPDGKRIAFYRFERKGLFSRFLSWWALSRARVQLVVWDADAMKLQELGTFASPVTSLLTKQRRNFLVLPLQWSPDGKELLVANSEGIYRVGLSSDRVELIRTGELTGAVWSINGRFVYYSDGWNVFLIERDGDGHRCLTNYPSGWGLVRPRWIRALARSPDGSKLAFGREGRLCLMNLASGEVAKIHESRVPIYWVSWFPSGERLAFLAGLPDRETGLGGVAQSTGITEGHYRISSIALDGSDRAEVFYEGRLDVRVAFPTLSPDGRFVAFISRPARRSTKVFIAATDGSGWRPVTTEGICTFSAWRPGSSHGSPSG